MSSPIHKYLFSPPPSPPRRPIDPSAPTITIERAGKFTALSSLLLPTDLIPRSSLDSSSELKPRSPRTPQQRAFTLNDSFPSPYSYPTRGSPRTPRSSEVDLEATPRALSTPRTPRQYEHHKSEKCPASPPPYLPSNVPSAPLPLPSTLPKPLLRLLFLCSLIISCITLLTFVPAARLPSLREASVSRRLALSPDGRAYLDVAQPVHGWAESKERDYVPAIVKSNKMLRKRFSLDFDSLKAIESEVVKVQPEGVEDLRLATPPPRTTRPAAYPLPESHEFLALQSYLLQPHSTLPETFDPSLPLDANDILSFSTKTNKELVLEEIERERENEVIIWYGLDGITQQHPHELLSHLSTLHTSLHHPTLLPCHSRPDREHITSILNRLGLDSKDPLLVIGNKVFNASPEVLKGNKFGVLIDAIGWGKKEGELEKERMRKEWKPKFAMKKGKSGEVDEVEAVLLEQRKRK